MSYTTTNVRFEWSKGGKNSYELSAEDLNNKNFKYFYVREASSPMGDDRHKFEYFVIPIRHINTPYLNITGDYYAAEVGLCDQEWSHVAININEIRGLSYVRNLKLKDLGI